MEPAHILIVDDESSIRFILEQCLKQEGYVIDTAVNGAEALHKLARHGYDLLLLDLRMEQVDGMEVLQQVRQQDTDIVVIILTAYSSVESAVEALRLGAFDYLFKPAAPEVIRQRVRQGLERRRKALRRQRLLGQIDLLRQALNDLDAENDPLTPPDANYRFIRAGNLVIDQHHRVVTLDDKLLDLTTAEFDILVCLVMARPEPVSPRQLVNCALGYDSEEMEARDIVKWHIHHLRQKIESDPANPCYIKTVRHKGYMWSGAPNLP